MGDDREVPDVPDQDQVAQAGAYLRMLLLRPGEYRARWEKRMDRPGAGIIGYEAVAEVLEPAAPRLPGGAGLTEVELTGIARRALEGVELSPPVAEAFIDEFGLTSRHARRLYDLLRGSPTVRVISGDTLPPPGLVRPGRPSTRRCPCTSCTYSGRTGCPPSTRRSRSSRPPGTGCARCRTGSTPTNWSSR